MHHTVNMADINFRAEFNAKDDLIFCSPNHVKQAFVAMIVNAVDAIGENGEILIRTQNPDDEHILVELKDTGTGISDQEISHIFEPFYSTKRESSGIGLGLAIVHGIVENHKGRILVDSEVGKGSTFSILFPLKKN
jgi:two-component system NtrC family sensor kinase